MSLFPSLNAQSINIRSIHFGFQHPFEADHEDLSASYHSATSEEESIEEVHYKDGGSPKFSRLSSKNPQAIFARFLSAPRESRVDVVASFVNATIIEPRTGLLSMVSSQRESSCQQVEFSNFTPCNERDQLGKTLNIAIVDDSQSVSIRLDIKSGSQKKTVHYSLLQAAVREHRKIEFLISTQGCMGSDPDFNVRYEEKINLN